MKMKTETVEAWGLASAGAAKGVWEQYARPTLTAKRAWGILAAGVVVYELIAPKGELMSEQYDRWLAGNKYIRAATILGTLMVTGHLLNTFGDRDPLHQVVEFGRGLYAKAV